jgi:S-adenosylmethionine decarboxylase
MRGTEWIIDAHGCDPAILRDPVRLELIFTRLIGDLALTPVAVPSWHSFPPPGGVTGFVMLAESHLACHTFPEFGSACLDLFCCSPRPDGHDGNIRQIVADLLGAADVQMRRVERHYGPTVEAEPSKR